MVTREREYTIDDVWRLERQPMNLAEKYYLIDGELCVKMSPSHSHGSIASEIARLLGNHVVERGLGRVTIEVGYHPSGERHTVLLPDVAFESWARAARKPLKTYAPYMPDLAVEVVSPSQTLAETRRKAAVYLRHGTDMVWLIDPERNKAERWSAADDGTAKSEIIEMDGELKGGALLPGFTLPLRRLFSL
ncbi:MAG: Uma2 family endonuclease [Chloroflexi bacterium]|nr:Uma2 family endonuclease [Chloroflexota bacterium]